MLNMKKKLSRMIFVISIVLAFSTLFIYGFKVKAFTFNPPNGGSYPANSSVQITLLAAPNGANQNAVKVRLQANNMQITNFVPTNATGWVGSTPDCSGGTYYTSTTICASLAKTITITQGEPLGVITATLTNDPAYLAKQSDNGYTDGSTITPDSNGGVAYTITGGSTGGGTTTGDTSASNLPNTAIGDIDTRILTLILGITIIVLVLVITRVFDLSKEVREIK